MIIYILQCYDLNVEESFQLKIGLTISFERLGQGSKYISCHFLGSEVSNVVVNIN